MPHPIIKISPGNSKLGTAIPNVSMAPGRDCGNCKHCLKSCYALKAYRQYPATKAAWNHNGDAFRDDPAASAQFVSDWIARKRTAPKFFRIHVSGDFLGQEHVDAWVQVASEHPATKFLAFTKMGHLDFSAAPSNLAVIYSQWPGMPLNGPADAPKAWMQDGTETRMPADAINCPGNCETCGMCWALPELGRDVYFDQH